MRISVFGTTGLPALDVEGTSDAFVKACIDDEVKETDTHWRCTNGKASFNYRILHQVKMPR